MKDNRTSSIKDKGFISKLSKGLMLPIALLPIAGLFLGIGSGIANIMSTVDVPSDSGWYLLPDLMTELGNVIFANLAILFAIGVAIAFTEDAGVAAFSVFVAWIIFNVTQELFIWEQTAIVANKNNELIFQQFNNPGIGDPSWNDIIDSYGPTGGTFDITTVSSLPVDSDNNGFIDATEINNWLIISNGSSSDVYVSQDQILGFINWFNDSSQYGASISMGSYYNVLFYENVPASVITTNLGISSMQTSAFGGITVGLFAAWLYNKFYKLQMPKVLGFFSGTKSVPIITFMFMPLLGFVFLFTWPPIGIGLEDFGKSLGEVPYGIDAFIFGIVERSLVPFGLHHAFYTPLWFTAAGGSFYVLNGNGDPISSAYGTQGIWFACENYQLNFNSLLGNDYWFDLTDSVANSAGLTGSGWDAWINNGYVIYDPSVGTPGIEPTNNYYFVMTSGTNPGEYMQGKYSFMIFGLPAAGAAMIMSSKKENRQVAFSIIGAAMLTTFLTGITEPLEFTFLFLAPMLYVFHVFMCGLSFWFADIMQMSMGMTFSGGIIDFALYGILPWATGISGVSWWWSIAFGLFLIPVYYSFFYWYITKFDIKTPGRAEEDDEIKLVSKAEYKAAKASAIGGTVEDDISEAHPTILNVGVQPDGKIKTPEEIIAQLNSSIKFRKLTAKRQEKIQELLIYLGGFENLKSITSCITKLRLIVDNRDIVQEDKIIHELKPSGIVGKGANMHIVFGVDSDLYRSELMDIKRDLAKK